MPVQVSIGLAFAAMAGALAAVFLTVAFDARTAPTEVVVARGYRIRRLWFLFLLGFAVVAFVVSMFWLPYQAPRQAELGVPTTTVEVTARQFDFQLSTSDIPVGTTVAFRVTSGDVNHGFAIYDPDGRIVGQVQAMPGVTNVLVIKFDRPGQYVIRCTELCGPFHYAMAGAFTVGAASAGGGGGAAGGGCGACGPCGCGSA
jgi:cytochrome c oxidase subunit 2